MLKNSPQFLFQNAQKRRYFALQIKHQVRLDKDYAAFTEECPANPLPHLIITEGKKSLFYEKKPLTVTVYLTRECNLRCITCYFSAGKKEKDELLYKDWLKVVRKLADIGTTYVYLLGGEPLLLPLKQLTAIIKEIKDNGMAPSLSTNGFMLSREVASSLKEAGTMQVQLSIDGTSKEVNDLIRGHGSFEAALNAASNLREEDLDFSTSMTLTSLNYQQAVEFIKLSEKIGAKTATIIVAQKFGRAKDWIIPNRIQVARAYAQIKSYEASIPVILNGFRFYLENTYKVGLNSMQKGLGSEAKCPAGRSRFVIGPKGEIYGCELLMNDEFLEGNALTDDLNDVWEKGFRSFRNRDVRECKTCPLYSVCGGGCPARTYAAYRSLNRMDPLCNLQKK